MCDELEFQFYATTVGWVDATNQLKENKKTEEVKK